MIASISHNSDLVSTLVDANVVDVSALSRLLASRRLVVIEDEDQTILKAIDKAVGNPLFSAKSNSYVLPAKGVGNFRAIADLGKVLAKLSGTKFDLKFIQDRDGMPDFISVPFLKAQQADGVSASVLQRHEVESYLLEPKLIQAASKLVGRNVTEAQARKAILSAGADLKAKARRASLETAKNVNRHLPQGDRFRDPDLEEKVYEWFDGLDFDEVEVVQRISPGKETLVETLKILNEGETRKLTRGHLVASIIADVVAADICDLLTTVAGTVSEPIGILARKKPRKTSVKRRRTGG